MKKRLNLDVLGIGVSVACAIHCAALPLLLTSLPIMGTNIINNEKFEYLMIFLAFAVGSFALWHGYRKHHHRPGPLAAFTGGILLLLAKQIWHQYQFLFLSLALLLIISAHVLNYRACRVHNHGHSGDCTH